MPKYDLDKYDPNEDLEEKAKKPIDDFPIIVSSTCKVCQSGHRALVDQMLANAVSYSEIERQMSPLADIPRRSIANHKEKHLNYEQAAVRAVIERNAERARQSFEEGKERLVTKQTYLEVALQKAYDQLMEGLVEIPAGEAVKLIEQLHKMESQYEDVAIDELNVQFAAFMQAVKEIVPSETWEAIREQTHKNLKAAGRDIKDRPDLQLAEAEIVEADEVSNP